MRTLNVSLTEDQDRFVADQVAKGRYGSASEVIAEALRVLEARDQTEAERLEYLRQAWREGIESGPAEPLDMDAIQLEARRRLKERQVSAEASR